MRQVYTTVRWTIELSSESTRVIVFFVALSVVNALTDGFTVMLVVPILSSTGNQNVFEGLPLLHHFGAFFGSMEPTQRLQWLAFMILAIVLLRGLLQYLVDIIIYVIPFSVDQSLRLRAFRDLSAARMSFVDAISIGEVTNYTASFPARVGIAVRFLAQMVSNAITIALMLMLLVAITPGILMTIGLFGVIASIAFKRLTGRLIIEVSKSLTEDNEKFNQVYHEAIHHRKPIKIFRAGELYASRIYKSLNNLRRVQVKMLAVQAAAYPFFSTAAGILVCVAILGASLVQPERGQALLALLVVTLVILFRVIGPISTFHICRMHFATHVEAIVAMHDFFAQAKRAQDPDGTIWLDSAPGEIVLENVSFAYSPDKKVLEDVSFRIQPGEMVAIVGQSGGGKTTLFYLLTRLYRPTAGRILVDGINLNDVKIESWWRHLSFMSQDSPIFTGTVRENIAFGSPEPDNLAMYENAMDLAAARDFINDLPEGLDSRIGEGSRVLSGGERQRIALARAFYAQPNVVLFDEATSQLDALTEMRVKKGIEELRRQEAHYRRDCPSPLDDPRRRSHHCS